MPKFLVTATMYTDLEATIKATNANEAYELAKDLDGSAFTECEHSGDWVIGDIILLSQ